MRADEGRAENNLETCGLVIRVYNILQTLCCAREAYKSAPDVMYVYVSAK